MYRVVYLLYRNISAILQGSTAASFYSLRGLTTAVARLFLPPVSRGLVSARLVRERIGMMMMVREIRMDYISNENW